ncbi:MAG: hypothetical protein H7246_02525 [Phycisphaerae bacterium]|nr:hypothetical protein [Saprospiraceae bacterium]
MSEEKNDPTPNEQPSEPKKPKTLAPKKNTVSDFTKNKNRFLAHKPGNSKMKGGGFKGGGVKKGK